jgi:hypothetical protein
MTQEQLTKQTKKYLLDLAHKLGLTGVNHLRKSELISRLQALLPPSSQTSPSTTEQSLTTLTRQALLTLAKQKGLTGAQRLHKRDLVARLTTLSSDQRLPVPFSSHSVPAPEPPAVAALSQDNHNPSEAKESNLFQGSTEPAQPSLPPLPSGYNDNRLVLLARDPYWLYAYWDFSAEQIGKVLTELGTTEARPILRIFDVTYLDFDGTNAWNHTDIALAPFATNWYIPVSRADASYCAAVGYLTADGRFAALGQSNVVATPRDGVSPSATLQWFTPPERQPSSVPGPQEQPLFPPTVPSGGAHGREAPSSAQGSVQHPSSWTLSRAASPRYARSGTITG